MSTSNHPEFFKLVFPDPNASRLRIPPKFQKMHLRRHMESLAVLIGPTGGRWNVKTCIAGGDVFLHEGWQRFARAHELQTGDLMIFQHLGSMVFKVKVFGDTGCKKVYSQPPTNFQLLHVAMPETSSDTDGEDPSRACLLCATAEACHDTI